MPKITQLQYAFGSDELLERLGFDTHVNRLVNAGLDNDGDLEILVYGAINSPNDINITYALKTTYIDADEILELLEEDHPTVFELDNDDFYYELANAYMELKTGLVHVRVQKEDYTEDE